MVDKITFEHQMALDAEKLASLKFGDLPTEEEWLYIQSKIED